MTDPSGARPARADTAPPLADHAGTGIPEGDVGRRAPAGPA